jgi:riboflavin kinase/FMN adenylyltransferase
MKIVRDVAELGKILPNAIITIGNFDGVHIGHQRVIKQVVDKALEEKGTSIILSFSPHTRKLLNHEKAPLLINTEQQKIELISAINPDYLCICEFNPSFASMKAEQFVKEILVDRLNIKVVYFSSGFAFGHKREGNISLLRKLSLKYGFKVLEVKPINKNGTMVSSSIIREMIASGQVDEAAHFLGRDYFIDGEVVAGEKRGRLLRYPTANILPENELLPGNGVYLSKLKLGDRILNGLTNIGIRPTFSGAERAVETYLFDFDQIIYSMRVRLFFLRKIREEKKFADSKQLARQIEHDIEKAHIFFRKH